MRNKRISLLSVVLICTIIILSLSVFGGCSKSTKCGKVQIICTIYPIYDWVSVLTAGTDITVDMLRPNGEDFHSVQVSFADRAKLSDATVVVSVGGESEEWLREIAESEKNTDFLFLMDIKDFSLYEEGGIGEGAEEGHEDHDHDHGAEYDEHLWLSPKRVIPMLKEISLTLIESFPEDEQTILRNFTDYSAEILSLDRSLASLTGVFLIVPDRFPFRYLCEDYGFGYEAAFEGCSAETDASFATVTRLASAVVSHPSLPLFVTESPVEGLADAVLEAAKKAGGDPTADRKIFCIDSMQATGIKPDTKSYLETMTETVELLTATFAR